jgi:hypothetical protein
VVAPGVFSETTRRPLDVVVIFVLVSPLTASGADTPGKGTVRGTPSSDAAIIEEREA